MAEEEVAKMCPISFLDDLDACDLENYKHPPFMWTLWYISLLGKAIYDKVVEILNREPAEPSDEPAEEAAEEPAAEEEAPAEEAGDEGEEG